MTKSPDDTTSDTWNRIDQALQAALRQVPEQREAWVRANYADRPAVRDAVLELLEFDQPAARMLEAAERGRNLLSVPLPSARHQGVAETLVGSVVGIYRLRKLLATGGMGAVYLADRDDGQFEQTVALKILPAWAGDAQTVARFRAERQILSSLQHPNITHLIDGGETPDGVPFLVTEFIDGQEITHYVEQRKPDLEALLRLFIPLCEAVQYAHRNLVIHRDIKPGNVLVDASGQPHLLDFGIAKLLQGAEFAHTAPRTATGFSPMTPEYASPEQRLGEPVTTASDIYQLGLLLYRLLTGQRPDSSPTGSVTRPSVALTQTGKRLAGKAGSVDQTRARQLSGDLDTIVLKALRVEPGERYSSAGEMAADLRRYLAGESITARRETLWSASRRLARHYPFGTGMALALVAVLLLSGASLFLYAREVAEQRDLAAREAQRAGQVKDVLIDLFRRSDPLQADTIGGQSVSVWDSIDAAVEETRQQLVDQPDIQAELLATLADLQRYAGRREESLALLLESNDLLRNLGPEFVTAYALNEAEYANMISVDDYEAAQVHLASALAKVPDFAGQDPLAAALVYLEAGHIERDKGNAERALDYYRNADEFLDQSDEIVWSQRIEVLFGQGGALVQLDRLPEAETFLLAALALTETHFGPDHGRLTGTLSALGSLERSRGNARASVEYGERLVNIMERNNATTYGSLLSAKNNLAISYDAAGRPEDAQAMLREVIRIRREMSGSKGSTGLAIAMKNLASSLHLSGDFVEALTLLDESETMMRAHLPASSPYQATPLFTRALINLDSGEPDLARPQAETALAILESALGSSHYQVHITRCVLAEALRLQGEFETASRLAAQALEGMMGSESVAERYLQRCRSTVDQLTAK